MYMDKTLVKFIVLNLVLFFGLLFFAYGEHNKARQKQDKEKVTVFEYLNGDSSKLPTLKTIGLGLVFGIVFGFMDNFGLWMGIDTLSKYISGGTLTKAAWGNTYSDLIGSTAGTFIASVAADRLNYDDDNTPIWLNSAGIFIGCILGMVVGKLITGKT